MPLKDRIRRAMGSVSSSSGSSESNSGSRVPTATNTPGASGAATPTPSNCNSNATTPTITLTKTNNSTRLSLTKTLTWSRDKRSKEEKMADKQRKRLEYWAEKDRDEWSTPEDGHKRSGNKKRSKQHQDMLRQFEFDFNARRRSMSSWISGISPGQTRVGSVDSTEGQQLSPLPLRKRSSGAGMGASTLSRQVTREEQEPGHAIPSVAEE
ncbi:uncharacterized protein LY89DRAFT_201964 [Mollisia scopiformis]|uniref:Uncharacterized protein n=1 Tax=Mollisia scopiformis TaxID=149040 RepID=A0A194WYR9_MOLSC|nr:uncharacterized protein LY89DRAFT_201964 [Mollisia scopiformis]KUJ13108.1 hypothetical protein LY89DRAFT_201964 [Mollisia scopiformis]